MKISDNQLMAALDITRQALLKPEGDLTSAEKAALLTVGASLVLDIHRIADNLASLTAAVERLGNSRP